MKRMRLTFSPSRHLCYVWKSWNNFIFKGAMGENIGTELKDGYLIHWCGRWERCRQRKLKHCLRWIMQFQSLGGNRDSRFIAALHRRRMWHVWVPRISGLSFQSRVGRAVCPRHLDIFFHREPIYFLSVCKIKHRSHQAARPNWSVFV